MCCFPSPEEFLSSLDHYEIAFPIQVDQNGDFLTFDVRSQLKQRPRRSLGSLPYEPSEQQVFYKVSAHRTQFLLNLTLHSNLLAEHFTVEYWKRDGMDWQHDFHEDCHYAGHLQDQYLSSKVAISNCNGLVSLYFTQPRAKLELPTEQSVLHLLRSLLETCNLIWVPAGGSMVAQKGWGWCQAKILALKLVKGTSLHYIRKGS